MFLLTLRGLGKSLLGLQSSRPLVLEPLVVLEEGHQGLGLLPHVEALVLVLLHKLEIFQGLNCKYVLLALLGNLKTDPQMLKYAFYQYIYQLFNHYNDMINIVWLPGWQYIIKTHANVKAMYLLAPGLDEIFQEDQCLVHVSPVLAVIVEPLPDHLHDLGEGDHVVGQVGNLRHLG